MRALCVLALSLSAACGGKADGPDGSPTNPRRLWFSGPESTIRLSEVEPTNPF